jgi:hypothetical protein
MGAADVNVDGRVTYREVAAFVKRANEAIPNRRYRPELSTTPPDGNLDAALATLPAGPIVLELDVQPAGRAFVESETGVRLVDLHAANGKAIQLHLPTDLGNLFVEQEATPNVPSSLREFRLAPRAGHVRLSALVADASHVSARGAGHEAFMHLFANAFDADAASAFSLDEEAAADLKWMKDSEDAARAKTLRRRVALGAFGVGAATAVTAGAFAFAGNLARIDGNQAGTSQDYRSEKKTLANDRFRTAAIFGGVAGAAVVSGAILWLWPDAPATVNVASSNGSDTTVSISGRF